MTRLHGNLAVLVMNDQAAERTRTNTCLLTFQLIKPFVPRKIATVTSNQLAVHLREVPVPAGQQTEVG